MAKIRLVKRSPNYPIVGLQQAITWARRLFLKIGGGGEFEPTAKMSIGWGLASDSSIANQRVATLSAYGLLDVEGQSVNRRAKLSDMAIDIIREAVGYQELIKQAAISPPIHKELWSLYDKKGMLPSDDVIVKYLCKERENGLYAESVGKDIARRFRQSLEFAGLLVAGSTLMKLATPVQLQGSPTMVEGANQETCRLREGVAIVQFPTPMSAQSFEALKDWLRNVLDRCQDWGVEQEQGDPKK